MLSPSGDHDGYSATLRALVGRVAPKIVAVPPAAGTVPRLLVLVPSGLSVSRVKTIVLLSGDHAGKVSSVVVRESVGPVAVPVVSRRKPLPSRLMTMIPGSSVGAADAEPW